MNRAFGAPAFFTLNPGALPQANNETAPLALWLYPIDPDVFKR